MNRRPVAAPRQIAANPRSHYENQVPPLNRLASPASPVINARPCNASSAKNFGPAGSTTICFEIQPISTFFKAFQSNSNRKL
jgi:hypothetical protein